MNLQKVICEKISNDGPISFCHFMDMALYYPDLGYYTSVKNHIGKEGDFYTSSSVSQGFGVSIARQLHEMWHLLKCCDFTVVEYGAGIGTLCNDILQSAEKYYPDFYSRLSYVIIEKSPVMIAKQKLLLNKKVSWCNSIHELGGVIGCVLSNELVDNMPVHVVQMQDELKEVNVDYRDGFTEFFKPAPDEIKNYFNELKIVLDKGFRTEVSLEAINWMLEVSAGLKQGYVITIDYGYPSHELYHHDRRTGTIACYYQHKVNYSPYKAIGEQDITAHVNFSALCLWGYRYGLEFCGFRTQGNFLKALGFDQYLKNEKQMTSDPFAPEKKALVRHTLIEDMGNKFKVLIQKKNAPEFKLTGFR